MCTIVRRSYKKRKMKYEGSIVRTLFAWRASEFHYLVAWNVLGSVGIVSRFGQVATHAKLRSTRLISRESDMIPVQGVGSPSYFFNLT